MGKEMLMRCVVAIQYKNPEGNIRLTQRYVQSQLGKGPAVISWLRHDIEQLGHKVLEMHIQRIDNIKPEVFK